MLLYVAGHETTVNLIGNGTLALLRNRDQLELLSTDPSVDTTFVDELLRYDSPVQMSRRITVAPYEIGGKTIEAGSIVMTCLGSANRDPAKWGADGRRARPPAAPTRATTCRSAAASTPASARTSPGSRARSR